MYKKIAIPLDGSPFSERILGYLPGLVTPHQTELVLLHVIELSHYVSLMAPDALHTVDMGHWRQEGEAYLKRVQGELRDQGYQVKARTIEGDVAGAICDAADQEDVDLIAMTTHGRSGFQNLLLGSVADRVVRTARQPVFLVRPQRDAKPRIPLQRLLVPLDGSELAELALPQAIGLAKANRGEIWLLQAIEFPEYWGEEYIGVQNVPGLISTDEQETLAKEYLTGVAERIQAEGVPAHPVVTVGHAVTAIANAADEHDTDLIVMSTHGRSGLSRWVFGSVAEKVVRAAACPVLLIRAREEAAKREAAQNETAQNETA